MMVGKSSVHLLFLFLCHFQVWNNFGRGQIPSKGCWITVDASTVLFNQWGTNPAKSDQRFWQVVDLDRLPHGSLETWGTTPTQPWVIYTQTNIAKKKRVATVLDVCTYNKIFIIIIPFHIMRHHIQWSQLLCIILWFVPTILYFWSNYSGLTRPHPKWWFSKGNLLFQGNLVWWNIISVGQKYDFWISNN